MSKPNIPLYVAAGMPNLAADAPEPGVKPWEKTEVVGKPIPRIDGYERVSGSAVFPSDVLLPNMLHAAILRCPHPHARVKSIDITAAAKLPGVHLVATAATPGFDLRFYYTPESSTLLFDPNCLFEGEDVAAVAAETPYQAADALRAIKVEYEVLPFGSDETKALEAQTPKVHEKGNQVGEVARYSRGDLEKGFAEAAVVLEQSYATACQLHTPLETHGCVASWDGGNLTLWESTQGVFEVQAGVARTLGLPQSRVRVIGKYMGGGFGSKIGAAKHTIIAALLAKRAGRPVKLFLTREETFVAAGNRPPAHMTLKAGVKKDGTLTALQMKVVGTGGAYPADGTGSVDWLVRDLYSCPNVKTEMTDVFINAGPARAMRAPGHPQGAWALEQMMDALAVKLGMDPVELRLKNIPTFSQTFPGNPKFTSTGLRQCLEEGAKAFGWAEARKKAEETRSNPGIRRGVGMASALWIVGGGWPPATVVLKLFPDGSVNLNMGASDIGTGTKTVMAMVVAEELGVDLKNIQIEHADTGTTQFASPSGGSKTVPTEAPTVRAAALEIKKQLLAAAAADLKLEASDLVLGKGEIVSKSDPSKKKNVSEISRLQQNGVLVGVGYRGPNPANRIIYPFAAQFCEVEVNIRTGEVKVLRFLGAHDSGRPMNRLTYQNQVFGGITMGVGLGLTEGRILDHGQTGKMLNASWHDYKIPTALDIPDDMTCVPIDPHDTEANSTGAKGLGEPATIPAAAALANAVYHATGVRVTESPISPMRLAQLLAEQRKKES